MDGMPYIIAQLARCQAIDEQPKLLLSMLISLLAFRLNCMRSA